MNKTIWKFIVDITRLQTIIMPIGAEILHVDVQHDLICLWAMVDPNAAREPRVIEVVGTGHSMPNEERKHLGTVLMDPFVWHIFERT
jgi:hypothetical protein